MLTLTTIEFLQGVHLQFVSLVEQHCIHNLEGNCMETTQRLVSFFHHCDDDLPVSNHFHRCDLCGLYLTRDKLERPKQVPEHQIRTLM